MKYKLGRYSKYIRPITFMYDLFVVLGGSYILLPDLFSLFFIIYITCGWFVTTWLMKFYEVFRFTKIIEVSNKLLRQFVCFILLIFAYLGLQSISTNNQNVLLYIFTTIVAIGGFKFFIFLGLKYFRRKYSGNNRKILVLGTDNRTQELIDFFKNKKEYGYQLLHHFEMIDLNAIESFIENNKVDEIYLSLSNLRQDDLKDVILLTDNSFINLKYIPTNKDMMTNPNTIQYYGYIPIIPEYKTPLEDYFNRTIKRSFDILFSLLVIICIMSWLYPLVALIIKIESKGPVIFKQKRNGLYYKEFDCYKFRSMVVNEQADTHQVVRNDSRITKFGKFLRKSSIDEMPQFFNVLIGNMSVCGPRPHMLKLTQEYEKQVHRYRLRHFIKPGITGMAQTHGYRGEIISQDDIVNRVKYDIFYIENWSLLLDIKIIYLTIKNAIKGEQNAY